MSELLRQVEEANEKNRRNVHLAMEEFARKLADSANGIPMQVERFGECHFYKANGDVVIRRDNGEWQTVKHQSCRCRCKGQ